MKLFATVGCGRYEYTTYVLDQRAHASRYCPVALASILGPSLVFPIMTREAEAAHGEAIRAELDAMGTPSRVVLIPRGGTREEAWDIFRILVDRVEEGDEIAYDITHGFRYLPLLTFLAGFYGYFVRPAVLKGVYYGAFEAKVDGRTPVFNLSSFEELIHWISASLAFSRFGSAEAAGELLARAQDLARRQARGEPVYLKRMGRHLESLSRAIMAGRTPEALDGAARLAKWLVQRTERVELQNEVSAWAVPFVSLLDRTFEGFAKLGPREGERYWHACLRLAEWYRDHGHIHLAGQLLRETVVTAVVEVNRGSAAARDDTARQWAEKWLNLQAKSGTPVGKTWAELRDCGNDLAHMGFRPHPKPVATVIDMLDRQLRVISDLQERDLAVTALGGDPSKGGGTAYCPNREGSTYGVRGSEGGG
ncbi:MAG TPA: TIGR02221 family CRISPR-associated protein [Firmicutes bacterium]|nr:TIGR02221 family CRISPR-associated protein [Bacillota bacterium]